MEKKAVYTALMLSTFILFSESASAGEGAKNGTLQVTSSAFQNGKPIPSKYTCDGANVSPPLAWSGVPSNTKSWAVICEDPDAPKGRFTHWIIYGIPVSVTQLADGVSSGGNLPTGAKQGLNDFKKGGYAGPCPPSGKAHRYSFTVYALDADLVVKPNATIKQVRKAMDEHVLAEGSLVGAYQRNR